MRSGPSRQRMQPDIPSSARRSAGSDRFSRAPRRHAAVHRRAVHRRALGIAEDRTPVPGAGEERGFCTARWGPMAVADLVAEWFETDLLQASIAARFSGPRWVRGLRGRAPCCCSDRRLIGPGRKQYHGGRRPGAVTRAMAEAARGGRRDPDGRGRRACAGEGRGGGRRGARRWHRVRRARGRLGRGSAAHVPGPCRSRRSRAGIPEPPPQLPVPGDGGQGERRPARAAVVSRRDRRRGDGAPRTSASRPRHRLSRAGV